MSDLEQETKPTAWKPMESAPKDGRELLVRKSGSAGYWIISWWPESEQWCDGIDLYDDVDFDAWTDIPS